MQERIQDRLLTLFKASNGRRVWLNDNSGITLAAHRRKKGDVIFEAEIILPLWLPDSDKLTAPERAAMGLRVESDALRKFIETDHQFTRRAEHVYKRATAHRILWAAREATHLAMRDCAKRVRMHVMEEVGEIAVASGAVSTARFEDMTPDDCRWWQGWFAGALRGLEEGLRQRVAKK